MQFAAIILATLSLAFAAPVENLESRALSSSGTGDMTFYTPGLGSCGISSTNSDLIVALAAADMATAGVANPNKNPLCNRNIKITYGGKTFTGKVVDTCPGCAKGGIDVSPSLFDKFAPESQGRLHGVKWVLA